MHNLFLFYLLVLSIIPTVQRIISNIMQHIQFYLALIISLFSVTIIQAQSFPMDSTFANNGFNLINMTTSGMGVIKVATQANGKILMCSSKNSGTEAYDFSVMRFNTEGKIDSTFGQYGIAIKDLQSNSDFTQDICIQNDDKIIVVGTSGSMNNRDFAMVRFNSDGMVDQTFGNNGVVKINVMYDDIFHAVHLQPDGKILAAGTANDLGYIYRFLENGTLDSMFGINGKVSISLGQTTIIKDIATLGEDEIFVAGQIAGFSADGFVTKLHADGSINTAFGVNGNYYVDFLNQEYVNTIACQNDGKILVGGAYGTMVGSGPLAELMVLRLLPDGTLDQSFNNSGILTFAFNLNTENVCHSLVLFPSGEIFASGYTGNIYNSTSKLSVSKIKADGSLDSTFALNGKLVCDFGSSFEKAHGSLLNSENKLVVSGYSGSNLKPLLCRFLTTNAHPALEQQIIKEGNSWNVLAVDYIAGNPNNTDTAFHTLTYKIFADTTINSNTYSKILSSIEKNPVNWTIAGYIREDFNHRVWMRETLDGQDFLLYDFGAEAGEELLIGLNQPIPLTVDSITEIEIEGIIRLKFWLSYNDYRETWITGIGSNRGICFSGSANISGGWHWLLCMFDENGPVYSNPDFETCYLATKTKTFVHKDFMIYPNPATEFISISIPDSFIINVLFVSIFDMSGNLIESKKLTGPEFHYSISHLKAGLYYCQIKSDVYLQTEKLVIMK